MTEATGVVNEMAEARLDTLAGDITFFESAVSGLKTEIGEKLAPTLRAIVQVATKFIGGLQAAFSSVFEGVEGSIISTETLMTVFKVMGGIIIGIVTVVGKVYNQVAFVINTIKALVFGLVAAIVLNVTNVVKAVAWGLDAIGVISTATYNDIALTSELLVEDLANTALEAAKAAGANFVDGYAGGAEIAGAKAFEAFSDSMDGIVKESKTGGEEIAEGIAEGIESGAGAVKNAMDKLSEAQQELVLGATTLRDKLQEQVTNFGLTEAQILKVKQAEQGLATATLDHALALEQELQLLKEQATAKQKAVSDAEALASAAKSVIESLRTPEEVYNDEVANFKKMLDAKHLSLEQFEEAVKRLKKGTENDIEVNIVTKGVIEGLQSALGSIKVAGQVSKTEKLAEKQVEVQKKIEQVMTAVKENTAKSVEGVNEVGQHMHDMAVKLAGTVTTDVLGLETAVGSVVTSINAISTDEQTKEEVKNLGGINNSGFDRVRDAIRELGIGGAIEALI